MTAPIPIKAGDVYGSLTVTSRAPNHKGKRAFNLICKCGRFVIVIVDSLRSGRSESCGCDRASQLRIRSLGNKFSAKAPGIAARNRVLDSYKSGAMRRSGLGWFITDELAFSLFEANCHYCGREPFRIQFSSSKFSGSTYTCNGIDRIDSNRGYHQDNVVPCCEDCNEMKMSRSQSEFLTHVERIHNHNSTAATVT